MNKKVWKFTKILLLIAMIFSELMTPIKVLANVSTRAVPNKGDIGINGEISNTDSVTVSAGAIRNEDGTLSNEGDVSVTKTVTPVYEDGKLVEGRYKIEFDIKGKDKSNIIQVTKPLYLVIVFDTSNSMICGDWYVDTDISGTPHYTMQDGTGIKCHNGYSYNSSYLTKDKWESAVNGAVSFSESLDDIANTYVSLVTFGGTAGEATDFVHGPLTASQFHYNSSGTNIKAGINAAQAKLNTITDPNAQKYIVVIGDGIPTAGGSGWTSDEEAAKEAANDAKLTGTKIFSIGYDIANNEDAQYILEYISSNYTVSRNNSGNIVTTYENLGYYKEASESGITNVLQTTFTELGTPSKAGTNATLTDNIGSKFKIVGQSGNVFTSDTISEITEEGTTISFEIEVDESKVTSADWYNTNEGFSLTYTDANGEVQTISTSEDPQVYWVPPVYEYTVNYYKDSISGTPIVSEKISATNGTSVSSVNQDKYLNNSDLGTIGYEFNSVSELPVTITGNGTVINVLYTIKKFSYDVNYYYDGELDEELSNTVSDVTFGTEVNAESLYSIGQREGYSLSISESTSGTIVIDDENKEINIYYVKNSYEYNINYHFNGETGFSKKDTALFGTEIKASDNYLNDSELEDKNTEDETEYFIHPVRPSNPNQITIGTDKDENIINIYYVSTVVTNEDMEKSANTNKITSGDTPITYTVNYTSKVNNVNKGDTVRVVVTDTLPLEIDEKNSNLNGGSYDATAKTITWIFEETMSEFAEEYNASKTITYTVVYKNVGNGDGSDLVNNVVGTTTAGGKTTIGTGDGATIDVEIPGSVIVHHYLDGTTTSVVDDKTLNGLVGQRYETSPETVFGYTLNSDRMPNNASGTYTEDTIEVIYYYTKNNGSVDKADIVKTSTNSNKTVDSIDGTFNYTITATGEVRDYVGNVTIEVVDTLPYALTEEAISSLGDECEYNSTDKTITCTRVIRNISEGNYTNGVYNVNEIFELELTFVGVDSETVTNSAEVNIKLDSNVSDGAETTEDVTVKDGDVIVHHYIDGTTTSLVTDETLNGLVGQEYRTESEDIFGYTVNSDRMPTNASGTYIEETIEVTYYYVKNAGTVEGAQVVKTSTNEDKTVDSIDGTFNYNITATGEVRDYVGDVTIEVVDTLPYALTEEAINGLGNECVYDGTNKTIRCEIVRTINEDNYTNGVYNVNETFNLSLTFVGVDSATVTNNAEVNIKLDSNVNDGDETTEDVTVESGNVIVTYKVADTDISLALDIPLSGLAGSKYTTEIKEFYGYSLVEVPSNKDGVYLANQTIPVRYEYTKNDGTVTNNNVVKKGPSSVSRIDDTFNYSFEYKANITGYTGKVTLNITDTLPFGAVIVSKDSRCTYDGDRTITCVQEYNVNSDTTIDEVFNVSLKYVNISFDDIATNTTLTNNLVAELTYGGKSVTNIANKDTTVSTGSVVVTYKDGEGNILHNNITLNGLSGEDYTTDEKSFFGYTLVEIPDNASGEFATNQTINVDYVYSKNAGEIVPEKTDVIKTSNDSDKVIESVDDVFSYTITAKGEVKDYVGDVTVIVEDTIPYALTQESISGLGSECTYDSASKTITCTRVIRSIDKEDYTNGVYIVNEVFNLELTFDEVTEEVVVNNAKVTIKLDSNVKDDDTDTEEVTVEDALVTVMYEDTLGNELHEDIRLEGLVGNSYTTEEKTFFGYTLTETPDNAEGVYTKEDIIVKYIYNKNNGSIDDTDVVKTSNDSDKVIDSVNDVFEYTINANGEVKDYVGGVTLKVVDNLPYQIDTENSNIGNCTYDKDSKTITCSKEYTIDEDDYTENNEGEKVFVIDETFTLELVFVGIDSDTVTNSASVDITLDDSKVTEKDEEDEVVTVEKGNVIASYKDTLGNKLHDDVVSGPELAGALYTTEVKEFFGYTLTEIPSNKDGKYLANQTITVNYVYSKNNGSIDDTDVVKTSNDSDKVIDSVNDVFEYTIKAKGEVKDYVGGVTLKVVDNLPYEIDTEKSNIGSCTYDKDSKTITCIEKYTIDEDNYTENNEGEKVFVIDETFTLELVFVGIDSETVTNSANVEIILDDSKITEKDEEDEVVTVEKGSVIATYKDTLGNKLHDDVVSGPELAGTLYTTEAKEFYGYTLTKTPGNASGVYTKEDITVNYVYSKNVGTSSEEFVKEGLEEVTDINSAFDYIIKYNTTIKDYIGEATLVITDELPYEIDTEKSLYNKENCKYTEGKLVCTYNKNITKDDNSFNIEEEFTLYYVNITDNRITNKASAVLTYGSTTKTNDSEYTSEVKTGTVTVNYVTKDGKKLDDSTILTGMVGESYKTEKKVFDKYNFIKVTGEVEGIYTEDNIEVTYVYDLTPLPPQTGLEMNLFIYIKYLVYLAIVLVSGKTYKLIKNN